MFFYKIENIVKNKNTNELQRITHSLNNCGYQRSHKKNITISICSDIIKCFGERVSFHSIVSHL